MLVSIYKAFYKDENKPYEHFHQLLSSYDSTQALLTLQHSQPQVPFLSSASSQTSRTGRRCSQKCAHWSYLSSACA